MLDIIARNLSDYPLTTAMPVDADQREAAVLLALTTEADPRVILTRRATHLNDHAGEVAFPGGMWEQADSSLLDTALRESHEEVSLPPEQVGLIATLPTCSTRLGVRVTPFVGTIPPEVVLEPELAELDAVFRVPLSFLLDKTNICYNGFRIAGEEYRLPCYYFDEYCIWGFTLAVLTNFLNKALAAGIKLSYPAIKYPTDSN